jgi:hypothetical protein
VADTQRSISDLLTNIFQDGQAANSITAQDLRDLIESMRPANGGCYITTPIVTPVAVAGTYYKALGTTTEDIELVDMTAAVANQLVYTGTAPRHFIVTATISVSTATNNHVAGFKLAKNGVVIDESIIRTKINITTDIKAITLVAHVDLASTDYIEVWLTDETGTGSNITIQNMHLRTTGFPV